MVLPPKVGMQALEWLTAKLDGNSDLARNVLPQLLDRNLIDWDGVGFSLDGTRRELLKIEPKLLDMPTLTRRIQAGDKEARDLAIDHDLMMARRQAPAVSNMRSYEAVKAELELEMKRQGLHT
jgi:hypothetical protein